MNTNSVEKLNNKENGLNLKKTYAFLEKISAEAVANSINEFWEMGIEIKLVGISENENFFFSGSEYFVTRIKLSKKEQFVVRLSKETVELLLDTSLGYNPEFVFDNLTELEAKILTAFNNLIYTNFSDYLYTKEELDAIEEETVLDDGDCNFTFFIKDLTDTPAKILITVPSKYLKTDEIYPSGTIFGIEDFPNAKVGVKLFIGTTTLPLNDVKNIEKEDIILLENSNINKMTLFFEDNEIGFNVSPEPSLIISFDNNNEDKNMSNNGNIWDNIQVDISAEFENVKISLGEIKQISEGLVIDMGSLYENKVYLKVENKTIAEGELVIINDRYGVRVDKIVSDKNQESARHEAPVENDAPQDIQHETEEIPQQNMQDMETPSQDVQENSDDFDYKDFDVDDENI